jgi:hypothetical protein
MYWGVVALSAVALYFLSFGPACWYYNHYLLDKDEGPPDWLTVPYIPCGKLIVQGPGFVSGPLFWYAAALTPTGGRVVVCHEWRHGVTYEKPSGWKFPLPVIPQADARK